jgi:hypothetical protein
MKDWSQSLPTWAIQKGYLLFGGSGTYDDLTLAKGPIEQLNIRKFGYWEVPNILELEDILVRIEGGQNAT